MRGKENTSRIVIRQLSAWLPVMLWAALIFKFSSGSVPLASTDYWTDFAVKKTGHVILFGAMALLIYRALLINGVSTKTAAIAAAVLSMIYGASDEFHQMYTQGREARVRDVIIDGLGAGLVTSVLYYLPSNLNSEMKKILIKLNLYGGKL
jgi:hypothetical protein